MGGEGDAAGVRRQEHVDGDEAVLLATLDDVPLLDEELVSLERFSTASWFTFSVSCTTAQPAAIASWSVATFTSATASWPWTK